jgi:tyrosine aminotransferase
VDAVETALKSFAANGYTPTEGAAEAREAVAKRYSTEEFKLKAEDVFLANGASGAIWLAIGTVCPRGSNVLFPSPGFTYCVASDPMGVEKRFYNCLVRPNKRKARLIC